MVCGPDEIDVLDEQLRQEPSSKDLLERFLRLCLTPERVAAPRRIECIATYVRLYPTSYFSRSPFTHVHPDDSVEGFRVIEQEWQLHVSGKPGDAELARGFALFLGESEPQRALEILRAVEQDNQHDAELYVDIGRVDQSPVGRLAALLRARELGATQSNLLAWIAHSALDAEDDDRAARFGRELLGLVADARVIHGDRLDWPQRGRDLWVRAQAITSTNREATELVDAIGNHANRKHWGHTVLGVVAVRRGDVGSAVTHLRESAAIVGEPRLSSYGPSFRLARELVVQEQWDAVVEFLNACRSFWDDEETGTWLAELRDRQVPEFLEQ